LNGRAWSWRAGYLERGFAESLNIPPIERSGNMKLVVPNDAGVFYGSRLIHGLRIVSPVRV